MASIVKKIFINLKAFATVLYYQMGPEDLLSLAQKIHTYQTRLRIPTALGLVSDPMTTPPHILKKEANMFLALLVCIPIMAVDGALFSLLLWCTSSPNVLFGGLVVFSWVGLIWAFMWLVVVCSRWAAIQNGETLHGEEV